MAPATGSTSAATEKNMILLLCSGDKSAQDRDIREAMAKEIER
jgi:putative component of toxin-antitoxin plasmid stabilization module